MCTETNKKQKRRIAFQRFVASCIALVCLFATTPALAKDYSFVWSANPEPVEGYKLYYKQSSVACCPFDGTGSPLGPSPIDVGKVTAFTITGLEENITYHFALTAYNGSEESGYSEIISVVAEEVAPVAVIVTTTLTGEAPFTLNFDGSSSTGAISIYSWTFGDGDIASGALVSHLYELPGTYTATLSVDTGTGLSHQTSVSITVTEPAAPPPVPQTNPTAVISSSSAVGNVPFTVQFNGSGSSSAQPPIVSYSWDFGDGTVAEGASVTHTYSTPGTYHAALTVRDSVGLTAQATTPVLIGAATNPQNQPPVSSFTALSTSGVPPLNVTFDGSGSSDPDGSVSEYLWSFGDGSQALGVTPQHTFTAVADYTVILRVTDDKGGVATSSRIVSVKAASQVTAPEKGNTLIPIINFLLLR
jgi:PKD repeat protein